MTGTKYIPKKLLMTTDTVGGVWNYCMELCNILPQVEFHLVTAGDAMNDAQKTEIKRRKNVVVYETTYKLEWMENPWKDIDNSGEFLLDLESRIQPDIIHLNSYAYASLPFNAPKIVVAHSDVFSWWLAVKNEMPGNEWNEYYNRVQSGIDNCDLLIAPSKWMLKSLKSNYGVAPQHKVIYNGRNDDLFHSKKKKPFVFSMGRVWDEAKNIQCLMNAAPMVNFKIRIAGEQHFNSNNLDINVDLIDYLGRIDTPKVASILSETAVYVLPAKYEPFGLSALEAALSGCALVLGNIPSLKEIWQDAALYFDVNNPESLANTINHLMSDKNRLTAWQNRARERAKYYSAQAMSEGYKNAYSQLLRQKQTHLKKQAA